MHNKKIQYLEKEDEFQLNVYPQAAPWHLRVLLIWNLLWTFCGAIVFWQLLITPERELRLFFLAYLALWAWFEYKGIKFYLWKRFGVEQIKINKDNFLYNRFDVNTGKQALSYQLENIKKIEKLKINNKSYAYTYQQSFWMPGNETIGFQYFDRVVGFGLQLNKEEVQSLVKVLQFQLKRLKSEA